MDKIDILAIHLDIQSYFGKNKENLLKMKQRLSELTKTFETPHLSIRTRNEIKMNIDDLAKHIENIENDVDYNFYLFESGEIIAKYNMLLKVPVKMSFTGTIQSTSQEKIELVKKFVLIAQKYYAKFNINFNIDTEKRKPLKENTQSACENCSNKKDFFIEDGVNICLICGTQQDRIDYSSSHKDSERVNISTKYTYDRKVHFRDCINQYQGKQNCTIDPKVYQDLENAFEKHHLLVYTKNADRYTKFSKITKEHIMMFLKELEHSKHYENVNLIHYNLTGKKPDDISYLEEKLLNDFDILVETYDKHFKKTIDRTNFISTQYVLYQLLQKYKHPCKKEDFVILKSSERKNLHSNLLESLFQILNWNYIPID
jgi:hypothetical protein